MIVYLTYWFRLQELGRAIACLYAAVTAASLIGSPLAGWLLGVHWRWLAGWRWLFILEGIPAIVLGIITIFYLTDWPSQARWLPESERNWLVNELQAELAAKKKKRNYTMMEVFAEKRILILVVAYLLAMTGYLGNVYWIPTFVKRVSRKSVSSKRFRDTRSWLASRQPPKLGFASPQKLPSWCSCVSFFSRLAPPAIR